MTLEPNFVVVLERWKVEKELYRLHDLSRLFEKLFVLIARTQIVLFRCLAVSSVAVKQQLDWRKML